MQRSLNPNFKIQQNFLFLSFLQISQKSHAKLKKNRPDALTCSAKEAQRWKALISIDLPSLDLIHLLYGTEEAESTGH